MGPASRSLVPGLVLPFALVFALGCERTSARSSEPPTRTTATARATMTASSTESAAVPRLAGAIDASTKPWTAHRVTLKGDAMWLCLPSKPEETSGDYGAVRIVEIHVTGVHGDIGIEILASTHGPFGLEGNLPDKHSGSELVRKEARPDKRWLFAERSKTDPWIAVTVGTHDKFSEEVVCTATLRKTPGHEWPPSPEAAAFRDLERICGSLRAPSADCGAL